MDNLPLHGVAVYNPALWSREELKSYFVARTEILDHILDDLRRERAGSSPQHRLILGLRGMGKSTLLRRIGIAVEEDETLGRQWFPLTFPEEQYNIASTGDLWVNCLDALGDSLEERGEKDKAAALDTAIENLPPNNAGAALQLLLAEAAQLNQRFLLLIDNIDLVLDRLKADHWTLRETLQSEPQLMIIGASARAIEASYQYDAAFYDFFKIDELKGLSETEMYATLTRLAELGNTPHVTELMEKDPGRLKTLHTLTGGNPRTIVLLYNVLTRGLDGDVRSDLEGLLDLVTPLYKARFEELPQQAQQLVDGLAVHWDPMTARQLAQKLGWDVNKTSSLLNRLQQQAMVEKVSPAEGKRAAFQIGERFFNIWYLMRASRRVRRKLIWLVHFLRMFFNSNDLRDHARNQLQQKTCCRRDAEYTLALSQAVSHKPLQAALEHHALHTLLDAKSTRDKISSLFDLQGEDAKLLPKIERIKALKKIKETIPRVLNDKKFDFDIQIFCFRLLGSPSLSIDEKQNIAKKADSLSVQQWQELNKIFTDEWHTWLKLFKQYRDTLYPAIAQGVMTSRDDISGAEAASLQYNCPGLEAIAWSNWLGSNKPTVSDVQNAEKAYRKALEVDPDFATAWNGLGTLLKNHLKRYDEAEKAYRKAIEADPDDAYAWNGLGNLLKNHLKRYDEAEKAFRKAIEADPDYANAWNNLGLLLKNHLKRYDEAEKAYKKAIEADPDFAFGWFNLGNLLKNQLKRYDEAEKAYRKAIEAGPDYATAWNNLGNLLAGHLKRYDEAEKAYRKAIEADPDFAYAWNGLGSLLADHLKRYDEAEKAYRKAIEADPDDAYAWNGLGNLLKNQLKRYDEAEKAFRKAIEADPDSANAWNGLGNLLTIQLKRYDEAEKAYKKAIEADPDFASAWNNFGNLLTEHLKRYDEAEEAFRKAIEADADDEDLYNSLAWFLYEQQKNQPEAITLARKSVELAKDNLHALHTLATLLVAQGEWHQAEPHIRHLITTGSDDFFEVTWPDMLILFKEAVQTGRAKEALQLVDDTTAAQKWRPLREALAAIVADNKDLLNGVAPEIRQPALQILQEITPQK